MRGDPTVLGWATVAAYAVAALLAGARARAARRASDDAGIVRFWSSSALGLLALGSNKQLDLQTDVMAATKAAAMGLGLYPEHRGALMVGVLGLALGALLVLLALAHGAWRSLGAGRRLPILAWVGLALYALLRAASFHHLDELGLSFVRWAGAPLLELGGIALLAVSALRRPPTPAPD